MTRSPPAHAPKGRGAGSNAASRFTAHAHEAFDDGWTAEERSAPRTEVFVDTSRTALTRNDSPDVPFDRSVNPYKGCEHGCVYCYARPTHAYLDLSPGLDFETKIFARPDAPRLLARELARPGYAGAVAPIALGANTDPYQPLERKLGITRALIEVLAAHRHPLVIVTKSALVERDIDLLAPMAANRLAQVMVSVTSLDRALSRRMEPRAAAPARRLQTIGALAAAGIPVGVLFAPVIPALNDTEMESVLAAAAEAGASSAGYVMLRLPREVQQLFEDWLAQHYPLRAAHVMSLVRDLRGGQAYSAKFGERMRGRGPFAELVRQRFALACRRHGLARRSLDLDTSLFAVPARAGDQLALF